MNSTAYKLGELIGYYIGTPVVIIGVILIIRKLIRKNK